MGVSTHVVDIHHLEQLWKVLLRTSKDRKLGNLCVCHEPPSMSAQQVGQRQARAQPSISLAFTPSPNAMTRLEFWVRVRSGRKRGGARACVSKTHACRSSSSLLTKAHAVLRMKHRIRVIISHASEAIAWHEIRVKVLADGTRLG